MPKQFTYSALINGWFLPLESPQVTPDWSDSVIASVGVCCNAPVVVFQDYFSKSHHKKSNGINPWLLCIPFPHPQDTLCIWNSTIVAQYYFCSIKKSWTYTWREDNFNWWLASLWLVSSWVSLFMVASFSVAVNLFVRSLLLKTYLFCYFSFRYCCSKCFDFRNCTRILFCI